MLIKNEILNLLQNLLLYMYDIGFVDIVASTSRCPIANNVCGLRLALLELHVFIQTKFHVTQKSA
jgi:hypothetical protein